MIEEQHKPYRVAVHLEKHPNADKLSLVRFDGYQAVTNTAQWEGRTHGVYVLPDSEVDTRHEAFAFLAPKAKADGWARIRAVKIRGEVSAGLLVPVDDPDSLPVRHYQPPAPGEKGVPGQSGILADADLEPTRPKHVADYRYDIENGKKPKFAHIPAGTAVWVTEKLHGENARYVFDGSRMWAGSRNRWVREYNDYSHVVRPEGYDDAAWGHVCSRMDTTTRNKWWRALTPAMEAFCRANPGVVLWGELYGHVKGFPYDTDGTPKFRAFDVVTPLGAWGPGQAEAVLDLFGVPQVPFVTQLPHDPARWVALAEGQSVLNPTHVREGVVVRTLDSKVVQKYVGNGYLLLEGDE